MLSIIFCFCLSFVDFPVDKEMKTGTYDWNDHVSLTCKVEKHENEYLYIYRIKNHRKDASVKFNWSITDLVMSGPRSEMLHWWDIPPSEELVIKYKNKEKPVITLGEVRSIVKGNFDKFKVYYPDVEISTKEFYYVNTIGMPGPIPPSLLKKKEE